MRKFGIGGKTAYKIVPWLFKWSLHVLPTLNEDTYKRQKFEVLKIWRRSRPWNLMTLTHFECIQCHNFDKILRFIQTPMFLVAVKMPRLLPFIAYLYLCDDCSSSCNSTSSALFLQELFSIGTLVLRKNILYCQSQ